MLTGKRILVTGVANADSIAFAVAERAQLMGADVALAVFPRDLDAAREAIRELPKPPAAVIAADATSPDDLLALQDALRHELEHLDGALHAIAFAPREALAAVVGTPSAAVELAFRTSTYSYAALAGLLVALASPRGASLVGLDFDNSRAWPVYNWMGPCKAALGSLNQYLARDLGPDGVRANLVAAGPLRTRAAAGIPGFDVLEDTWAQRAPLAWDLDDPGPAADTVCFLLSDLARGITGEIVHVDGGVHAVATH